MTFHEAAIRLGDAVDNLVDAVRREVEPLVEYIANKLRRTHRREEGTNAS